MSTECRLLFTVIVVVAINVFGVVASVANFELVCEGLEADE